MRYEVILKYHQDNNSGLWGFAPINTINQNTSFNAFWGADGIFHDVLEHYTEGMIPYYSDKGFMTLWGEMCASAHGLAYRDIGINNFRYRINQGRDFCIDTFSYIQEYIYEKKQDPDLSPYIEFDGSKETCLVPYQKPTNNYNLEDTIYTYHNRLDNFAKEKQVSYADFFWKPGIARNYIYGYKLAQKIIGRDENHSYNVLDEFLREWNEITKMNPEHLWIDGSEFGLYGIKFIVENKGKLKITTSLIEDYSREEFNLNCLIIKI